MYSSFSTKLEECIYFFKKIKKQIIIVSIELKFLINVCVHV